MPRDILAELKAEEEKLKGIKADPADLRALQNRDIRRIAKQKAWFSDKTNFSKGPH